MKKTEFTRRMYAKISRKLLTDISRTTVFQQPRYQIIEVKSRSGYSITFVPKYGKIKMQFSRTGSVVMSTWCGSRYTGGSIPMASEVKLFDADDISPKDFDQQYSEIEFQQIADDVWLQYQELKKHLVQQLKYDMS